MIEARKNLEAALFTGLIDKRIHSLESLQPNLVLNDKAEPSCVLDTLNSEFSLCDEFEISVAFVTKSGVAVIMAALLEARCRGVTGRLLVSEYLMFTQPEALRALQQFENIEVRVATSGNMHGKGYSFYRNGTRTILIGSSNLTASALKANNELNLKVIASENGKLSERVSSQFLSDFEEGVVADDQYIHDYEERYLKRKVAESKVASLVEDHEEKTVSPNSMQVNALNSISALREAGQKKALLISATGTGKTYLSAFDVQAVEARRVLFVVHRKNIAIAALETYRSIFGEGRTYGLYSGSQREIESDFVFSTVQTISRREHYEKIPRDYFDYVVIDETHRSGAKSYQALIEYLKPQFLLGMTATPERTDGHDVFSDFDHNIAYEIRLHQAMEEKILSPFHYFGVTDITVNGQTIDELSSFNALVSEERGDHILKQISAYGCDDGVVRGLIFCSRTEECRGLSHLLNSKGLKTIALTGDDSEEVREEAINRLESDDESLRIDYIITVDIFNEGIDIPRVNQIVMLRPTSSAIVFVQQLGRGLRLAKGKDYLTVIDFIGNYQNNYLVPIALYGDTSYNKDTIRRLLSTGSNTLPGSSTVNFDQISKKRIFEAIDQTKLDKMKDLKRDYELLKFELGRQPMMMDFVDHGGRDPFAFVNQSGSYYGFLTKAEKGLADPLSDVESTLLSAFSREINNGKRVEDSLALRSIIKKGSVSLSEISQEVYQLFGYYPNRQVLNSVFHNLSLKFVTDKVEGKKVPLDQKFGFAVMQVSGEVCSPGGMLVQFLRKNTFKSFLLDSTEYSIHAWSKAFERSELIGGFILYEKYSRKDVFRILNWTQNPVAQNVGGYVVSADKKDCAIFVNYEKSDHSSSTKYIDEFIDESQFQWMSKNRRKLTSPEIATFQDVDNPIRIPLFIKKSNDEGLDFYYMGEMKPIQDSYAETVIKNDDGVDLSAVTLKFDLQPHVKSSIYKYIVSG